jgi:hypothetical protein
MSVKKMVIIASSLGFLVPLFWGIAGFVLFNLKEGFLSDVFWGAVYITCPFWVLPGLWGSIVMPFLNAALYGGIAFIFASKSRNSTAQTGATEPRP